MLGTSKIKNLENRRNAVMSVFSKMVKDLTTINIEITNEVNTNIKKIEAIQLDNASLEELKKSNDAQLNKLKAFTDKE